YQNALIQIAPASGLIGVGRESFNTTKQFQKIWLEHLLQNRCRFQNACCNSCDPCCNSCDPCGDCCDPCGTCCENGLRVWSDSFGYYGHQENKDCLNGYKANTWGAMLG